MTPKQGELPPPGWYADPEGGLFPRWWNGQQWFPLGPDGKPIAPPLAERQRIQRLVNGPNGRLSRDIDLPPPTRYGPVRFEGDPDYRNMDVPDANRAVGLGLLSIAVPVVIPAIFAIRRGIDGLNLARDAQNLGYDPRGRRRSWFGILLALVGLATTVLTYMYITDKEFRYAIRGKEPIVKIEEQLVEKLEEKYGRPFESASCPHDKPLVVGAEFQCLVTDTTGSATLVDIEMHGELIYTYRVVQ